MLNIPPAVGCSFFISIVTWVKPIPFVDVLGLIAYLAGFSFLVNDQIKRLLMKRFGVNKL